MRIIAGKYKGRSILNKVTDKTRPTTGRVREGIFSILTSGKFIIDGKSVIEGAIVCELYCGTGSIALEALSRGASYVIAVDKDQTALIIAKQNFEKIGELKNAQVIRSDATMLPKAKMQCDIVFVDPPYELGLVAPSLKALKDQGWLKETSIITVESSKYEPFTTPEGFQVIDERIYGKARVSFLKLV